MADPRARVFDGYKFMWDWKDYPGLDEAQKAAEGYRKDNFETRIAEEDGKVQLYTRRVVTKVVVEGQPPP